MADDEIVPEGEEYVIGPGTMSVQTFRAVDGQIVVDVYVHEPRTTLGIIGEALYPPLQIVEIPAKVDVIQGERIDLNFFMIPTTFNETFKSRWSAENLSDGRINPIYNYGGTERQISLSFTLAAYTVQEARSNLAVCQKLARTVYGRYRLRNVRDDDFSTTRPSTIFESHKTFTIDFGGLIRDETAFINKFAFAADMDAGVFDYFPNGQTPPWITLPDGETESTHTDKGVILPRAVKIEIGFTIIHDSLLGFGGQNRPGEPLRWAENRARDWPHGTGKIDVQEYMKPSEELDLGSLPIVFFPSDDGYNEPIQDAQAIFEQALQDSERRATAAREEEQDAALELEESRLDLIGEYNGYGTSEQTED
tara:strand:- start:3160 stop:4254 length:1095 start_codon:yes stop_codon:yes gene_type:complete